MTLKAIRSAQESILSDFLKMSFFMKNANFQVETKVTKLSPGSTLSEHKCLVDPEALRSAQKSILSDFENSSFSIKNVILKHNLSCIKPEWIFNLTTPKCVTDT